MFRILLTLAAAAAVSGSAPAADPLVFGHRGLITHSPEETLANNAACIALRVNIELDVRRTRDGRLVCLHDATLDRTTTGSGRVAELSLDEIRGFDAGRKFDPAFAGERVPTLDEVFALIRDRKAESTLVSMDLKVPGCEVDAVALAEKHGVLKQVIFTGLATRSPAARETLLRANKDAACAVGCASADALAEVLADQTCSWVYAYYVPSADDVRRAHAAGKKVYSVGKVVEGYEPESWAKSRAAGVDAILTDYPLECRESWRKPTRGSLTGPAR